MSALLNEATPVFWPPQKLRFCGLRLVVGGNPPLIIADAVCPPAFVELVSEGKIIELLETAGFTEISKFYNAFCLAAGLPSLRADNAKKSFNLMIINVSILNTYSH